MGYTRRQLDAFRGGSLPDLLGPELRLLFVGINPGLWTVAVQSHFGRRGNRFYPALYHAGITDRVIDASAGFLAADAAHLIERGLGITNLVGYATARADEIPTSDLLSGATELTVRVHRLKPDVVAVLGVSAYRVAFRLPKARVGEQPTTLGGAQLWVAPNPSGLNAHATITSLADSYRQIAVAAGIDVYPQPG